MATKRSSAPPSPKPLLELVAPRDEAKNRLQLRIETGLQLKQRQIQTPSGFTELSNDFSTWTSFNSELLKRLFTTDEMEEEYESRGWVGMIMIVHSQSLREKAIDLFKNIASKIHNLESIIERLELIPGSRSTQSPTPIQDVSLKRAQTKKVFVVHGHDEKAKANLEVFLHEVGLEPVVLHRQADEGMTVIEKFEKHSDVGYAFILLTPDEVAYLAADETVPDSERTKEFRARPNVIFEFGYFVGKLGRSRVCCLYTGNVSLPSDVNGMVYKRYEKNIEEAGMSIIRDLKAAGYVIS